MRRAPAVAGSRALPAQQLSSTSLLRRTCGVTTSCRAPAGGSSCRPFQSSGSSSTQCHVQHRRQSLICSAHQSKGGGKGGSSKGGAGSSTSVLTHPDSSSPDSNSSSTSTDKQAQAAAEAPGPRQAVPVVGDVAVAQPPQPGPASGDAAAAAGAAAGAAAAAAVQSAAAGTGSSGNESSSSSSSSSGKLNVMSFDEEDIDSISDMYAVINRASVIVSKQQQQQGTAAADGVPGSSSGSSGRTFGDPAEPDGSDSSRSPADQAAAVAAAQATVMSFDEEDIDSMSDMYAVINRASVIVSEQKQQLQQQQQQQQQQALSAEGVATPSSSPSSSAAGSPSLSRSSSSGSLSGGLSSEDLAAIAELQTATERKLADLQLVVEELDLEDEEMSQQLTDVLNKLGALEQELSAAVHHSISTSSTSSSDGESSAAAAPPAPTAAAAAAAAGAALLEPPTAAAAVAGRLAIEHTVELEALAEAASMGARPDTPVMDVLSVPMVPAPTAAAAVAAVPAAAAAPAAAVPAALSAAVSDPTKLWPLFVLGLSYVHQATSGFALPALLPMVSPDLHLTDFQGALLTSGYSYLYALALVPVGLLADKVDRPKLLAVGLGLWSMLSIVSSGAGSFAELLVARTGFAVAQAAQNPVSFSLIPDLFPANKSTALAGYNCAIYLGRALSFASVLAAHRVRSGGLAGGAGPVAPVGTMADAAAGAAGSEGVQLSMVPLDKLDLQRMSIIYTTGDMAAVTPLYNYNFHVIAYESAAGSEGWRELLRWIGYPGFAIALLMALTVKEPRGASSDQQQQGVGGGGGSITDPATWKAGAARVNMQLFNVFTGHGWHSSSSSSSSDKDGASSSSSSGRSSAIVDTVAEDMPPLAGPACVVDTHAPSPPPLALSAAGAAGSAALAFPNSSTAADTDSSTADTSSSSSGAPAAAAAAATALTEPIKQLLSKKSFQATTIAAALNDLGSYALIAWHSTFYERVFGLDSGVYAPMLAVILPVGGILGGVGGGLIADYLSVVGGRYWLTAGASLLAAPFIAQSLLADSPGGSFSALLAGFALSEAWRAPGAIMIRSVAPQELGSTASALYLCIRNLVGGAGPVAVAKLAEVVGLQHAMLLAPACYVVSGLIFLVAEKEIEAQQKAEKLAAQQEAEEQAAQQQQQQQQQEQQQAVAAVTADPQQLQAVAVGADSQKQQKQQQS